MRIFPATLAAFFLLLPVTSWAQSDNRDVSITGWTQDGLLVLETERQGEVLIDDAAQTFYFETTELVDPKSSKTVHVFQKGEMVGAEHPDWKAAKPESQAAQFLATKSPINKSWVSPNGEFFVSAFDQGRRVKGRCEFRERVVLMDRTKQLVLILRDKTNMLRSCPQVAYQTYWKPDSSEFVVERQSKTEWSVFGGSTSVIEAIAEAPLQPWSQANVVWSQTQSGTSLDAAWTAYFDSDFDTAIQALSQAKGDDEKRSGLLRYLFLAKKGATKDAVKQVRKAYKSSPKTALDEGIMAAVFMVANHKRGPKYIKSAAKRATDFATATALGALFVDIDLSLSNQLLIAGLSAEDAKDQDTTAAYVLLVQGLIDAGEFDAAEDVIGRYKEPPPELEVLSVRLKHIRKKSDAVKEARDLVISDSGRCAAYAAYANTLAASNPGAAFQQFQAAAFCDPGDAESQFYLGDFAIRRGEAVAAADAFEAYLKHAPERAQDEVRRVRRSHAETMIPRMKHEGAVLLNVTCRGTTCQGTVKNTSDAKLEKVEVKALEYTERRKKTVKKRDLGSTELPELEPDQVASFVVTLKDAKSKKVAVTAGRNKDEQALNFTRP